MSGEDWGTGIGPEVENFHDVIQRCRVILEYDGLMCHRCSLRIREETPNLTISVFQNGRYSMVVKGRHARPFLIEPEIPLRLVSDNGEVQIGGPRLANFTPSHIDADRITSVGFRCTTAQGPGGWGSEGKESTRRYVSLYNADSQIPSS